MKTKEIFSLLCVFFCGINLKSVAQANTTLSNLTAPTAINQSLIPNSNDVRDLGTADKSWRTLYIDSSIYLKDILFLQNKGVQNTLVGENAGRVINKGKSNAVFGYRAMYSNKNGSSNTALGSLALYKNTADNNTAVGYQALYSNTTATLNTAIGYQALYSNTTGSPNTAIGWGAMYYNTTGIENTAVGQGALYYNTTGQFNIAVGRGALFQNNGSGNTATGFKSLFSNTTGVVNTADGYEALISNITGSSNCAIGNGALYFNINGFGNTGLGASVLFDNNSGSNNTGIGSQALSSNATGANNIAIGAAADVSSNNLTNAIVIGALTQVDASNKVRIGNNSITSIGGQVGWSTFSDGRYKRNIKQDVKGLDFINALQPVTYTVDINGLNKYYDKNRRHDTAYERIKADMKASSDRAETIVYNGFIAQDVEKAAAKLNYNFSGVDKPQNKDGLYGLRYADFVVPLVKAVQELSKINDAKDSLINAMKDYYDTKIDALQNQLEELKTMITTKQLTENDQSLIVTNNQSSLQQNVPNPFTNSTSIGYSLPNKYSSSKLVITDRDGKALKAINLSGNKGNIKVDTSALAAGAYQYSLYVDGKLIDTKQMIISK